jgi:general L-amino acid transport system permease protein
MNNSSSIAFVRQEMLPQSPPPMHESGVVKWVREKLFSSVFNTIMTLTSLAVLFFLVQAAAPWLLHSVWDATSLAECRQIIEARYGEEATGACWAVLRERWPQFLFGFYPSELYWRPVLTFVLLFAALAPVLFTQLPRKTLLFSLAYPAIAFWLIWGGSIWVPVTAMIGLGVGYLGSRITSTLGVGAIVTALATFVSPIVWWLFLAAPSSGTLENLFPIAIESVPSRNIGGFLLAFTIGVTGIAFSLPLGILLALGRQSDMLIVNKLSVGFIEFIRGVPLITLLFTASQLLNYFLPPGTDFDLILRVIIMVTFFAAAYIAEVIRGGLAALPKGQYEAADALGLDYWKATRLIIMPQALKIAIPGIVSTFIGLFKDTTLVVFVNLYEPLKGITDVIRNDIAWKGIYWEPYIFVGALFFIICFSMSRYSMYLENKLKTDHR